MALKLDVFGVTLRVCLIFFGLFSSQNLYANEPFWKLASQGMTRASTGVVAGVVIVFVTFIAIAIIGHIRLERKIRDKKKEVGINKFNSYCEEFGISKTEKEFMSQVVEKCNVENVEAIFLELPFFEIKIDEFVRVNYNTNDTLFWERYTKDVSLKRANESETKIIGNLREKFDFSFKAQKLPLVTTRQINIGQRLYVRTDSVARGVEASVRENNLFFIRAIKTSDQPFDFRQGDKADIFFDRDGQYKFSTTIVESNEAGLSFLHSEKLVRTQHRNDVRYETSLPTIFKILHRRDGSDKLYCKENEGVILDISGGGIKFSSRNEVLVNDEIMFKASWDDLELKFKVIVLRTNIIDTKKETIYMGFCKYSDIDKLLKEKIIKKIFESIRNELKIFY